MQLFYRNREGVTLTEEGKNIYEYIMESIVILGNVEQRCKQYEKLETGSIKIRTGTTVANDLLNEALVKFIKKYPNIKIDVSNGDPNDSIRKLSQGDVDLVLLNLPYDNNYNNIIIEECIKKEYIFVMSPEYQRKNNVQIDQFKDLKNYQLIFPRKNTTSRNVYDFIMGGDKEIESNYELTSETIKVVLAKNDCGISFIDRKLVEKELKEGSLIEIKIDKKFIASEGLAMLQPSIASYAVKELVKMIKENLK